MKLRHPLKVIFSGQLPFAGAVAGGGTTAQSFKSPLFKKIFTPFQPFLPPLSKSGLKTFENQTHTPRSKLIISKKKIGKKTQMKKLPTTSSSLRFTSALYFRLKLSFDSSWFSSFWAREDRFRLVVACSSQIRFCECSVEDLVP